LTQRRTDYLARPTRRLAVVVMSIGVATIVAGGSLGFAAALLVVVLGAVVVDAFFLMRSRGSSQRSSANTVALNVASPFSLETSPFRPSRVARLRQPSSPDVVLCPDESSNAVLSGTLTGTHRGIHHLNKPVVRLNGPLGLMSRDATLDDDDEVRVIPDLPKARRMALARRHGLGLDDGRVRNRLGVGTDFESIREYSPDDDIRQVNWVASSRSGRLMSNQYRIDENRDIMCLIDTGRLMASPVGELNRLDVALDAMTILCVEAEESQDRVGAMAFSSEVHRRLGSRRYGTSGIIDALYDLEPSEIESDYERAFIAVGRHKRALVVVFTDLVDESASRALLSACPILTRHHALMVVSCLDPDLASAVNNEPHNIHDVLRTSVALDLLSAKNRVRSLLSSMGAVVVEADAEKLGSACVRSYFTLKSRARL
jgi:uncharacterized protein (DUF58 family)